MPPVGRGAAHVVDRRGRLPPPARRTASAHPRRPAGRRPSRARRPRTPRRRERPARRRRRRADACAHAPLAELKRERADRDDHRVARADLRELLRPWRARHAEARDQLVGREHVALRADDELLHRDRRAPRTDSTSTSAPLAYSGGSASPAGEDEPRLPPIVPRLRICGEPTVRDAIASPGSSPPSSSIARAYETPAPTRSQPSASCHSVSSPTRVRSSSASGRSRPKFELDHHVGPAPHGRCRGVRGLRFERTPPIGGLEELHPPGIHREALTCQPCLL